MKLRLKPHPNSGTAWVVYPPLDKKSPEGWYTLMYYDDKNEAEWFLFQPHDPWVIHEN